MSCLEAQPLLGACLDGELDLRASLDMEEHIEGCPACAAAYQRLELLRAEIAAVNLDFTTDAVMRRLCVPRERRGGWRVPACFAAAAVLVLALFLPARLERRSDPVDREVVDSHLRSLLADHLIDVPSSDRHTVKPWFQGRVEFAPAVPDLTAQGFVLAGGRLDVIDGRKVPVLVYRRREHVINLWISPGGGGGGEPALSEVKGYRLIRWQREGMTFRAVSDLDGGELRVFVNLIRGR